MSAPLDYKSLGFRCGLEIHQQLATAKLFCGCSTEDRPLNDARPSFRFVRRLRPTQSELGEIDAAARVEAARAKRFDYSGFEGLSCLVESDEEPPHEADRRALDLSLTMGLLLNSRIVDEVEWMRKIVIDGSNTSGFQRTGLVALGGTVDGVGIQAIALEEDSARRIGEADGVVRFGLDRLGIPLIEISTDPDITSPEHARKIAARIGALLRATGGMKRGIGTIRQDLNVSISGGARVEIKGVQELNSIPRVLEREVQRQQRLLEIRDRLRSHKVAADAFAGGATDLTAELRSSASKVLAKAVSGGGVVLGARLDGCAGLLGPKEKDGPRLGRELADAVRQDAGLQGLFHGDELPGMGITDAEVAKIREHLRCGNEDSFLLVAGARPNAERAVRVALERMRRALDGVPSEVRAARPDDTTTYLRPMPGAARMYPETDVPPVGVPRERLDRLRAGLPELPEVRLMKLATKHSLSTELATQILDEGLEGDVDELGPLAGDATLVARTLLATIPEILRKHPAVTIGVDVLKDTFEALARREFAKEGLPAILEALAAGAPSVAAALGKTGLGGGAVEEEVRAAATRLVTERAEFVRSRGEASVAPLMGALMKVFRGKVDGALVNKALGDAVRTLLIGEPKKR